MITGVGFIIFLPILLVVSALFSLPLALAIKLIASAFAKIEEPKYWRCYLAILCSLLTAYAARLLWYNILPLSFSPTVLSLYFTVDIAIFGGIFCLYGKHFWKTSWRKAGIVSAICTTPWLLIGMAVLLFIPSVFSGLANSAGKDSANELAVLGQSLSALSELQKLVENTRTGSTQTKSMQPTSQDEPAGGSREAANHLPANFPLQAAQAFFNTGPDNLEAFSQAFDTLASRTKWGESVSKATPSVDQPRREPSASNNRDRTSIAPEHIQGVSNALGELAKASEFDARAQSTTGRERKVAQAESDAAALRAASIAMQTMASAQQANSRAAEAPTASAPGRGIDRAPQVSDAPGPVQHAPKTASLNKDAIGRAFELADKELNGTYKKLMSRLSPEARARVKASQVEWIKRKESTAKRNPEESLQIQLDMTAARIAELEEMLK